MSRKIIGVTVGTSISPEALKKKMNIDSDTGKKISWNDIEDKPFDDVTVCYDNPSMQLDDFCEYEESLDQDFLIPGETYEVVCKGATYVLECFAFGSNINRLECPQFTLSVEHLSDNSINMLLSTSDIADEYEVISFKVGNRKSIKTLDSKYLPMEEIVEAVTDALPDTGGNVDLTGVVKSVNGVAPDENGNVEIDIPDMTEFATNEDLIGYAQPKGDYVESSALTDAVNDALAQAKESGEFDGKTPVKGTDYYTEADKTEMVNAVLSALPTWTGGAF